MSWPCQRLGVKPSDAAFVDDVPANVDGAAGVGLHAVLHESTPTTIRVINELIRPQ
jgi:putative hydrolase of the HAD superfamily